MAKETKKERKIGVPESEYRAMRRAMKRQARIKFFTEQLWNLLQSVK